MPFSVGAHAGPVQAAHLDAGNAQESQTIIGHDVLVQSRETGDIVPESIKQPDEGKKAKPFAHFVAGGYVVPIRFVLF